MKTRITARKLADAADDFQRFVDRQDSLPRKRRAVRAYTENCRLAAMALQRWAMELRKE